jgi:nucleoside-diphosphate-sugar epimerase
MAYAHVLAAVAMTGKNNRVNGQVYFITDGPGANFFKFFDRIVEGAGYAIWPENLWLPRKLAFAMGAMSEFIAVLARPVKRYNPKFSRFAVTYTCTDFTFLSGKATRDFGFVPKYSEKEALERTIAHYRKPLL